MRALAIVGVILAILGIASLIYGGVSWTEEETIMKLGPVEAEAEKTEGVAIPPAIGIAAIIGGVVLVGLGWRGRSR